MDYSGYKNLIVEKKDKVAVVTLNRPDSLNAFSFDLHKETVRVFEEIWWDKDVWAVVLTGAGRAFSAGGDIRWFKRRNEDPQNNPMPPQDEAYNILRNIVDLPKPVIAAVNGAAMGLGASIAFACDIIIAAENARIADPHVSVGLAAGDGGCVFWPLMMGMCKAKQHLFTGDPLTAQEAERLGIINKVVPQDQVLPEAKAFARRLVEDVPPLAVRNTKKAINMIVRDAMNRILIASTALEFELFESNDHVEAVNAFLEKRKATYTGT